MTTAGVDLRIGKRAMERGNRERSLVSKVMDGLVAGIVESKYGAVLPPQDVLSREFDVSRTVMREALSMLLAREMLDVRPKTGTRVRPVRDWRMIDEDVVSWRFRARPDSLFLRDALEFRQLIEPRASALAAARGSAVELAGIRDAYDAFAAQRVDETVRRRADELLHTRIVGASGNQFLEQMAGIVRGVLSAIPPVAYSDERWMQALRAHERVVDAIERRDPPAAQSASLALIDATAVQLGVTFSFAPGVSATPPARQ